MHRPRMRAAAALLLATVMLGALPRPAIVRASDTPDPKTVTVPGTIQSALGCPGDWQPACQNT